MKDWIDATILSSILTLTLILLFFLGPHIINIMKYLFSIHPQIFIIIIIFIGFIVIFKFMFFSDDIFP